MEVWTKSGAPFVDIVTFYALAVTGLLWSYEKNKASLEKIMEKL